MTHNWFEFYISPKRNCFWFRLFGYGMHFKNKSANKLFSERNGYRKYYSIGFGWRVRYLGKGY